MEDSELENEKIMRINLYAKQSKRVLEQVLNSENVISTKNAQLTDIVHSVLEMMSDCAETEITVDQLIVKEKRELLNEVVNCDTCISQLNDIHFDKYIEKESFNDNADDISYVKKELVKALVYLKRIILLTEEES